LGSRLGFNDHERRGDPQERNNQAPFKWNETTVETKAPHRGFFQQHQIEQKALLKQLDTGGQRTGRCTTV